MKTKTLLWVAVAGGAVLLFVNREKVNGSVVRSVRKTVSKNMEEQHPWVHWAYTSIYGDENP